MDAVFKTVVANQAQFGVVPIENSHTGISATTRDLLVQGALNVTGEIYIPVRHHLLSHCKSLDKLTHIYSHSQGFEQCNAWLSASTFTSNPPLLVMSGPILTDCLCL